MNNQINIASLPDFDAAEYLDTPEAIAAYLNDILESGDAGLIAAALGDAARARGMTQVAADTGLTREALYKALRSDARPRLDTIARVLKALGLRLTVQPAPVLHA